MKKTGLKQLSAWALALGLTVASASGVCASETESMRIAALKGPTAMGLVQMMDAAQNGDLADAGYEFSIAASADVVTPLLVQGETDIASVPANLASVLYNNTKGGIEVLAVNTLGVLYVVDTSGSVKSVEDLKGKTIYASGKGATPEYALDYILRGNGLDPETDVSLEWKSEHAECLAALLADPEGIAMLPQPFVTTAQMKNDQIQVVLDLTEEWDKLQEGEEDPSGLITGVTVVRKAFAEEHPEAVNAFLSSYAESAAFANEHVEEAAKLIGSYEIVPEEVAVKALPFCNITLITGDEMKEKLSGYLSVLYEQNPASVGGTLPADDFYYVISE